MGNGSNYVNGDYEIYDESGRSMKKRYYHTGFQVDPSPSYITYAIIIINVFVWLIETLAGGSTNINVLVAMGAKENGLNAHGEYWRLLTPVFLHAGFDHLFFNSFALYIWGRYVEALLGKTKYIVVYLISGIMGSLFSYLLSSYVSVGASGAIFGLFGAMLYFRKWDKELFNKVFGIQVIIIIGLNLFDGFTRAGIDNFGHVGGLIGGYIAANAVGLYKENRITFRKVISCIIIIIIAAMILWFGKIRYLAV